MDISEPVAIDGFPVGVNNLAPDYALPQGAMRDGQNIDIYDNGKFRRRKGSTKKMSATSSHSLWHDPKNPNPDVNYYVSGTSLYSLRENAGTLTSSLLVAGLAAGRRLSYVYVNGDVFWTNGIASGRIRNGVNVGWGVEAPSRKPILTASVGGALYAGTYQVVLTYRNSLGEESGTDGAVSVAVPDNGKIVLTGLAAPLSADVIQTCVYATSANGDVFHKIATIPSGSSTCTITTVANATTALKTQFLQPMLPGDRIAHLHGVIYVAVGPYVFHTEPLRYGLCNINENFYTFPADVTEILAVPDGLYVCADKTYFLSSPATPDVVQKVVLPYGAVHGTGTYLPNSMAVAWFSPRGQVVAVESGQVKVTTEANYMPGTMSYGASIVREKNGLKQIINTVQQSAKSSLEYIGD